MNSLMLPGLTLPPYWTRTASPTSAERRSASVALITSTTCPASVGSAVRPVPIAQIGS